MTKIKTSEATGRVLDWLAAKALGANGLRLHTYRGIDPGPPVWAVDWDHGWVELSSLEYSSDWSQGGPIIEQELNNLFKHNQLDKSKPPVWCAVINVPSEHGTMLLQYDGLTPLVAAMRCFVASKLGDEVEVPDELLE